METAVNFMWLSSRELRERIFYCMRRSTDIGPKPKAGISVP
jgi:hypothetical protein